MKSILFITTSASRLDDNPTGIWFEELSTPFYILQEKDFNIDFASPKGGKVPYDPRALDEENIVPSVKRFINDDEAMHKLNKSKKISATNFEKYDAIFFPGGHGAVVDLPYDKVLAEKLGKFFDSGKLIAAICHGPGGLVKAKRKDGNPIIEGLKVTCFSNSEEGAIGMTDTVPFLLESRLKEVGAIYSAQKNFKENVVVDKNLITGQNPASSKAIAESIIKYYSGARN